MESKFSICEPWSEGYLVVTASDRYIESIHFGAKKSRERTNPLLTTFRRELKGYLAGERRKFTCPLELKGTPFQRSVWRALAKIPHGETVTYGELAKRVGKPKAARAIGNAVGKNPVPVAIPCHRVLASGNRLGGFSGGLAKKRALLKLEGIAAAV